MELLHGFPFNDVRLQACREKFALVPTDTEHPVDQLLNHFSDIGLNAGRRRLEIRISRQMIMKDDTDVVRNAQIEFTQNFIELERPVNAGLFRLR